MKFIFFAIFTFACILPPCHGQDLGINTISVPDLTITQRGINNIAVNPKCSADGRFVVYETLATNCNPNDVNSTWDIIRYDSVTGNNELVSVTSSGEQGNYQSTDAVISADGRYVAFTSWANNLVEGDENDYGDIFIRDMFLGETEMVSKKSDGSQFDFLSERPSMTLDGSKILFSVSTEVYIWQRSTGIASPLIFKYKTLDPELLYGDYPILSGDGKSIALMRVNIPDLLPTDPHPWVKKFTIGGYAVYMIVPYLGYPKPISISDNGGQIGFSSYYDGLDPLERDNPSYVHCYVAAYVFNTSNYSILRLSADRVGKGYDFFLSFSSNVQVSGNGKKVVFKTADQYNSYADIYTYSISSKKLDKVNIKLSGGILQLESSALDNLTVNSNGDSVYFDGITELTLGEQQVLHVEPAYSGPADARPITLEGSASSGLPLRYWTTDPLIADIVDGKLLLKEAGLCSIYAWQVGDKDWESTDIEIPVLVSGLSVRIKRGLFQVSPTNIGALEFSVKFSKAVKDFNSHDVIIGGTAPGIIKISTTGSGDTYKISLYGMTGAGTVTISIPSNAAHADGHGNRPSYSPLGENSVYYDGTDPKVYSLHDPSLDSDDDSSSSKCGAGSSLSVIFASFVCLLIRMKRFRIVGHFGR